MSSRDEPEPGSAGYDAYVAEQESIAEDRARPAPPGPLEAEYQARRQADAYERWLMSTWP